MRRTYGSGVAVFAVLLRDQLVLVGEGHAPPLTLLDTALALGTAAAAEPTRPHLVDIGSLS
jgi:hypothetical protein